MIKETADHIGLLKTKYSVPSSGKELISRRIPDNRLEDSLNHKLTLVTAPAGYGKTTTVLKWLENISLSHAWLTIDAGDNESLVFWRYFCAALDSISEGISQATEYVFASQELFSANVHLSILIDSLSTMSSHFLLVLDDLHLIDNLEVYAGLRYLITYMPPNMHLIIISRAEPRLKLARLNLKDELVRIGSRELRFETEEISQYFKLKGYFLQEADIQRIESYTEGWAAALVAVTLSLKEEKYRNSIIHSFGSCNSHIENYLAEDVFNTWTLEQQEFMEETAILNRLCGPLCDAVTDFDGSRLLIALYKQNSFLIALDDEGIWFRYHHLFSDFLKKKLKAKDPAMVQHLHHQAGEWLQANGDFSEAIEHFMKGTYYEEAVPLIELHGGTLIRRREYSNVMSWIDRLPAKYVGDSLILMIFKTTYLIENNDFLNASKYIEHLELEIKDKTFFSESIQTTYLMAKTNFFLMQGDTEKSLQAIMEASIHGINTVLNKDYLDINSCDISIYRTIYHSLFKIIKKSSANYSSFVNHYRSLISETPGYAPLIEGEFHYESGSLDKALPKLIASVDEAVNANCLGALVPAVVSIAKIKRAQGDIPGALKIIEECEHRVEILPRPHWNYILSAFKARLYIDMNDVEGLDRWMAKSRLSLHQNIVKTYEYPLIVLARALIHKRRYADAIYLLNRLLSFAEGLKRLHSIVEISNLLAIAAMKNFNEGLAEKHLEKALSIGMNEGYVRSFVDELVPMVTLLEMYSKRHTKNVKRTSYAKKLLNLTKEAVRDSLILTDSAVAAERLTPMEKKVLQLIIRACTNKEIAAELGITLRTVKAHTNSIYKKLGVKNRAQCIVTVKQATAAPDSRLR